MNYLYRHSNLLNSGADIDYAETEEELFSILIEKVRLYDPDMLVGYEVQNSSWGYLIERGAHLGMINYVHLSVR